MDRDQTLRVLGEREAAGRAEWLRLEQKAARIAGLIEACRQEIERLAITQEVLSGLVTGPAAVAVAADPTSVARHGERVRHRLKKLAVAGLVREVEPWLFTLAGDSGPPTG